MEPGFFFTPWPKVVKRGYASELLPKGPALSQLAGPFFASQ
jgi:hypothetical protein